MSFKTKYLTEDQIEEIDHAFLIFDKDRSGSIDIFELKDALKALGIFLKKEDIKQVMTKVDKDGSGAIDKDEFKALMAEQIEQRDQEAELNKVFQMYDDDDNGLITSDNLYKQAKDLEEQVTQAEVSEMIRMADRNKKGAVDAFDFMLLMRELGLCGEGIEDRKKK